MAATILSAFVTCAASLFLGQAALRLAGAGEWNWLAPPVGLSVAMLVAAPAIDVPGRSATTAVLLGVLTVAAAGWCLRSPPHRPPLPGLLAATPVALLVFVPFAAAGHAGTLGTSMNNDMSAHLLFAEGYLSSAVAAVTPLPTDYPFGPHAMVAAIGKGLGIEVDAAFAGWTLALPILNAWTALALARRASWLGRVVAATVVGMPFLVAAYYGQGAFKEVAQAGLVLAVALLLAGYGPVLGRARWVPLALLLGGIISVYSVTGLPWPLLIAGVWLVAAAATYLQRHSVREAVEAMRGEPAGDRARAGGVVRDSAAAAAAPDRVRHGARRHRRYPNRRHRQPDRPHPRLGGVRRLERGGLPGAGVGGVRRRLAGGRARARLRRGGLGDQALSGCCPLPPGARC